jgi:hypothetical protein
VGLVSVSTLGTQASFDSVSVIPNIAPPTFNPDGGTYGSAQNVTISGPGTIYYTTNSQDPTEASTQYTGTPVPISSTTTLKAISRVAGVNSGIKQATYTINTGGGTNGSTLTSQSTGLAGDYACPGQSFTATVTMTNSGTRPWATATQHQLVSLDAIWGTNAFAIPISPITAGNSLTMSLTLTAPTTAGTYNFRWQMKQADSANELFGPVTNLTVTVPNVGQGALPNGWSSLDIGSVLQHGCSTQSSGTFKLYSAGHIDTYVGPDTFHFVYQPLTGDGSIIARIASITPPTASVYQYAGVMLRADLGTANTRYVLVGRRTDQPTMVEQHRADNIDIYGTGSPIVSSLPAWVKLTRTGNTVTVYESTDGTNWGTAFSTLPYTNLPSTVYVGLVSVSTLGTQASFDSVSIVQ